MRRLGVLLRWDLTTQYRHGLWAAGLVVAAMWAGLLAPLNREYLDLWLPVALYSDVVITGLMFVAGMLFFEREQGSIAALVVTPVRTAEYLVSKVISLTLLTLVIASSLTLVLYRGHGDWVRLLLAFTLGGALFTLLGFLVAARFNTVSTFLTAFGVVSTFLALPILDYFGLFRHPLVWLLPVQPPMVLFRQAFHGGTTAELLLAVTLQLLWIGLAFALAHRAFHRRVSYRRGAA